MNPKTKRKLWLLLAEIYWKLYELTGDERYLDRYGECYIREEWCV